MYLRRINTLLSKRKVTINSLFHRYSGSINLLEKWKQKFEEEKIPEVQSSLKIILANVLNVKKLPELPSETPQSSNELSMTKTEQLRFEQLCECRMARMPVQYIIGEWDFRELTLKMQPPVFIPRPETEELVELILQQFDVHRSVKFLEIGCGTGCISLALLHSLPMARGTAVDQSQVACNLTTVNARTHKFENRIQVICYKLTEATLLDIVEGGFDLIVSNPPYVPSQNIVDLESEIKLYEDLRALDGGKDGLTVIKNVLRVASTKLRKNGLLWLEVDPSHPDLLQKYLKENISSLELKYVACYKDMFQKDRFVEIIKL